MLGGDLKGDTDLAKPELFWQFVPQSAVEARSAVVLSLGTAQAAPGCIRG